MSGIIGGIISGLGNYFGAKAAAAGAANAAKITGKYNLQGIQTIVADQQKARDELNAARARGLGYIDTGMGQYTDTVNPLLTPHPITLASNRGLTEQQTLGLQDLNRQEQGMLAGSGLRGSGRGGAAVALDATRRYILGARGANDADTLGERRAAQGRADAARTGLAGAQLGVGGAKAAVDTGTANSLASSFGQQGTQSAALLQSTGQAGANAASTAGNLYGGATIGTANVLGQGVGGMMAGGSPNSPTSFGNLIQAAQGPEQGNWDTSGGV